MAANFSEYTAKKILDQILTGGAALPLYTDLWVALFHDSSGTTEENLRNNILINEIADTNYTRVNITITGAATFDVAIPGGVGVDSKNNIDISFSGADAAYPNDVAFVALVDASTSGNVIVYSSITATAIGIGEYIKIPATSFVVNL